LLLAVATVGGCTAKPGVTVDQVHDERARPERTLFRQVFPPKCAEIPTAEYPDVAPDERPDLVSVRVDLTIDMRGEATELTAEVLDASDPAGRFASAALAAAAKLRCSPALRPPRADSREQAPQPVAYRSSLVYRFYRDRMQAAGSF
jgi:hypothetical protein